MSFSMFMCYDILNILIKGTPKTDTHYFNCILVKRQLIVRCSKI